MANDIVSRATRRAFQESYVAHAVLREIAQDFDDAGVERGELPAGSIVSGERRRLVEEYYATVDWGSPSSARRVLDAFEAHLGRVEAKSLQDDLSKLIRLLSRDGIGYEDGRLVYAVPHQDLMENLLAAESRIDLKQLRVASSRIRQAIDDDPALAIGASKELVEATCRAILRGRGVEVPKKADLPQLARAAAERLSLLPEGVADQKRGAEHIRKVLGSLAVIVQGLAELRNLYGTGHGQEGGLHPRHARLCAGAATTLTTFLVETDTFLHLHSREP